MDHHILLYIDPDAATRLLVQKALVSEGFVVVGARTACEAQEAAALASPDLAVIDVDRVRAADLVPALRRSAGLERARLLASTAYTWPAHLEKMLALGFDRVLLQPFDIDTLAQELASALPPETQVEQGVRVAAPADQVVPDDRPADVELVSDQTAADEMVLPVEQVLGADHVSREDATFTEQAETPAVVSPAVEPLESVEVPVLWQLALTPLTASLVRATAAAEGALALYDEDEHVLAIVAVASSRHAVNGAGGEHATLIGTRVSVAATRWLLPALENREAVVVAGDAVTASSLVPPGSQTVLVVPVASRGTLHGVAILAKHRAFKAPIFTPDRIARAVSQAEQIAGIVDMLHELERGTRRRRRELERARLDTTRALLTDMTAFARQSRRNGAGRERSHGDGAEGVDRARAIEVGDRLAERFALSQNERQTLRQAIEVWDVGRAWVEHVLFARATFSVGGRERLLDAYAIHGAEILNALDWPPAVVQMVRAHQLPWRGGVLSTRPSGDEIPLPARIMAVATAFATSLSGRGVAPDEHARVIEALTALHREAGTRYDPDVVETLRGLCLTAADPVSPRTESVDRVSG